MESSERESKSKSLKNKKRKKKAMSGKRRASERSSLIHNHSDIVLLQMKGFGEKKSPLRNFKYF